MYQAIVTWVTKLTKRIIHKIQLPQTGFGPLCILNNCSTQYCPQKPIHRVIVTNKLCMCEGTGNSSVPMLLHVQYVQITSVLTRQYP